MRALEGDDRGEMNVVAEEIRKAVEKELSHAEDTHGLYSSMHEKYAVMLEELQEAEEELKSAREGKERMWKMVRVDNDKVATYQAYGVANAAERLAIEAVQLAATARKQIEIEEVYLPRCAEVSECKA